MAIPKVIAEDCTGCEACVEVCNDTAISMNDDDVAFIDSDKCTECNDCIAECPTGAIVLPE